MLRWLKQLFSPSASKEDQNQIIAEVSIAGLQHYRGDDLAELVNVGDALTLQAEPHNAYDPNAIMVMWNHNKMGYIPASLARDLRRQIQNGVEIDATIIGVKPVRFGRKWIKVRLAKKAD